MLYRFIYLLIYLENWLISYELITIDYQFSIVFFTCYTHISRPGFNVICERFGNSTDFFSINFTPLSIIEKGPLTCHLISA